MSKRNTLEAKQVRRGERDTVRLAQEARRAHAAEMFRLFTEPEVTDEETPAAVVIGETEEASPIVEVSQEESVEGSPVEDAE